MFTRCHVNGSDILWLHEVNRSLFYSVSCKEHVTLRQFSLRLGCRKLFFSLSCLWFTHFKQKWLKRVLVFKTVQFSSILDTHSNLVFMKLGFEELNVFRDTVHIICDQETM